ncbi:MAG: TetR/AcrR family transcriptional regulator [Candidatus Cloacimonetes bacterium]|nr:TetR/AcrR family transcriptional regulator [Candidatus Cloacimonadota bacterium]
MSIRERKAREKQIRRQTIIDAAEKLFFQKGFENATMDAIAQESELSKGTLYLYFKNKTELCSAIMGRGLQTLLNMIINREDNKLMGLNKLKKFVTTYEEFARIHFQYHQVIMNFRFNRWKCDQTGDESIRSMELFGRINQYIADIIREGIGDGSICREADPMIISHIIWDNHTGLMPGQIINDNLTSTEKELDYPHIIKFMFDIICSFLAGDTRMV